MEKNTIFHKAGNRKARLNYLFLCLLWIAATLLASQVQQDFGRVRVKNIHFENFNGLQVRGKLFVPVDASAQQPKPGIVYVHGYQNNRETSDPYCIELSRRGVVALCIDALGRGNSDNQNTINPAAFDPSSGAAYALQYLRGLDYVLADQTALMGHSMGAEMVYQLALRDAKLKALVISGYGYTLEASSDMPKNMLMIFGKYDEYRGRMTHTADFENEWMQSAETRQVFGVEKPQLGEVYGNFAEGTARKVFMPMAIHFQESHDKSSVAAAVDWILLALQLDPVRTIPSSQQIWEIKEWATLVCLLCAVLSLLPLGYLFLSLPFFSELQQKAPEGFTACRKDRWQSAFINGALMLLYLPLILTIFGFHMYVVPIDGVFPMMMLNGVVFWFVVINVIGFIIFRSWWKKHPEISLVDLGISDEPRRFVVYWRPLRKVLLLALLLFGFVYGFSALLEALWIVDLRFIFPFASDFTPYRFLMFMLYLPFFFVGFWQMGIFLHAQMRPPARGTWFGTFLQRTVLNWAVMIIPLIIHLAFQYVPIFLGGTVPFVGPGSALVGFVMNLFHMIIVLLLIIPVSTWFSELTGRITLGAVMNALLVTWMFTSSSVIAPIPV
jgi:dienelactone hydrolase